MRLENRSNKHKSFQYNLYAGMLERGGGKIIFMRRAIVPRNAFNKSQNQINIQCGVLVREAKRVQKSVFKRIFGIGCERLHSKGRKKSQRFFSGLAKFQSCALE